MKYFLFILIATGLFQKAGAQLTGKIIASDSATIPFVNVSVLKSTDSSIVKSGLTGENGAYRISDIPPGSYKLRFSSIGYQVLYSAVFDVIKDQAENNFEIFIMQRDKKQLDEVIVRAAKPLFQQRPEGSDA